MSYENLMEMLFGQLVGEEQAEVLVHLYEQYIDCNSVFIGNVKARELYKEAKLQTELRRIKKMHYKEEDLEVIVDEMHKTFEIVQEYGGYARDTYRPLPFGTTQIEVEILDWYSFIVRELDKYYDKLNAAEVVVDNETRYSGSN